MLKALVLFAILGLALTFPTEKVKPSESEELEESDIPLYHFEGIQTGKDSGILKITSSKGESIIIAIHGDDAVIKTSD